VGDHLLLGGDNMDLALAYTVKAQLSAEGKEIDAWQLLSLIQSCRRAKEDLFADASLPHANLAIPTRGSGLFAKTISTKLERAVLEGVVLDGFLPLTAVTDLPVETGQSGLQEFGLPYASDPVISKHLARFLTRSLENVRSGAGPEGLTVPRAPTTSCPRRCSSTVAFSSRTLCGVAFWICSRRGTAASRPGNWKGSSSTSPWRVEPPSDAANRASGKGLRIKAGTARSYYIGLEASMPAIPGFKPPLKAVCVVPQGMEEGSECVLAAREFGLVTGREATFRFFSSEVRGGDEPGNVGWRRMPPRPWRKPLPPRVTLPAVPGATPGDIVPVRLQALVTELGNLELWMQHTASSQRWKLDFKVRTQ